ncbi:MAG: hypothetical protein ISS70_10995 [Phycisphaerae bacterium]|nr:hypothetical protein [Phycisphaerae bacterium]
MSRGNGKERVSQLIQLLNGLNRQYEEVVNAFMPLFRAFDLWARCAGCAELYHRYLSLCVSKPSAPSAVLDRLASASLSPFKKAETDLYLEKVISCGDIVFPDGFDGIFFEGKDHAPLEIWGHVLDICGGTLGETNALVIGNELREFCAGALNEKGEYVEWTVTERVQQYQMTADFLTKSSIILGQMRSVVLQYLDGMDVTEHPNAKLARVLYYMRRFRDRFVGSAAAIGPYLSTARSPSSGFVDWLEDVEEIETELWAEPGILRVEQSGTRVRCSFRPTNGNTVEWEIGEWTGESVLPKYEPISMMVAAIFGTWSYATGEFLGYLDYETESRAYWYVSDDSQISAAAYIVTEEAYPLINNKDYESLAKRAMDIVYNNQPAWYEGRVQWSYVRDVDEVIAAFERALRVYGLKHGTSTLTVPVGKQAGKPDDDILPENRTKPMSISEMAGYWEIRPRKLSTYVKGKAIKTIRLGREDYIFDTSILPKKTIEALRKDDKI